MHKNFVSNKSMVCAHYTMVCHEMPDASLTVKQLRQQLLNTHYDDAQLRELADGAEIQHSRIKSPKTLRQRLHAHFADYLPEDE